ncbi:uncharacterized protein BXZ73DRAFT_74910 [Epithele typhae]|uniref:uncharacterized protein n=1 Tax=Epithele typhae TaxID=378194 RepID=UPI002008118C|nr:uncharacterized protein BXZ73DRAFT_74910 [Epithele typhae]KAH9941719.1 hypothetical protein BXZ73DRAFT_74910 [Epithele typhae]
MYRRPTLRLEPDITREKRSTLYELPSAGASDDYPHNSVFRSAQLEVHVRSQSIKIHRAANYDIRSLPVFGDHDKVSGNVLLDLSLCCAPGRLTVYLQGSFLFASPNIGNQELDDYATPRKEKNRHVFFTASESRPTGELDSPRSTTSLRDAFTASVRSRQRRPSQSALRGALRPFPFSFEIPRPEQSGQELPPTFSSVASSEMGPRGRTGVERAEVSYSVTAVWEAFDRSDRILVEAPIIYQPEADFQSLDGHAMQGESWLEIPLKADRPVPFSCAVTIPHPATFSRSSAISYFVVFTTTPRSATLAREIAADATISVSLLRDVRIDMPPARPGHISPTSSSPTTSGDESDAPPIARNRLLRRVVRNPGRTLVRTASLTRLNSRGSAKDRDREKPLPQLPPQGIVESRVLHTDVSIGFPKRPRFRMEPNQRHPSLDEYNTLPDGLYKGRIGFEKHMIPSFDWVGLRVKYYLEVTVIVGQDQMRARVPLRIT